LFETCVNSSMQLETSIRNGDFEGAFKFPFMKSGVKSRRASMSVHIVLSKPIARAICDVLV
jgi:hypothetical protein